MISAARSDPRGFGFAGFLVLLGIFLLLWNFGALPSAFWSALWPLWPLLVVAAGLNLLLSRLHPWAGSTLAVLLVAGAFGATWWIAARDDGQAASRIEAIEINEAGARATKLNLTVAAADLRLAAGEPTGRLIEGTLATSARQPALRSSARVAAGTLRADLSSDFQQTFLAPFGRSPHSAWDLRLRPGVPTEIWIDGGAGQMTLDLTNLDVRLLDVDAGAAETAVRLPAAAGETRATFDIGATSLDIDVPEGVAARIRITSGISSTQIDERRFPEVRHGEYRSPDYARAANRVDIKVNAGVSDIQIR